MSITLHTDLRFPCPQRLQLVLVHLKIPLKQTLEYDILQSEQKTDTLLKINPAGSVPFILDDAFSPPLTLSESRAIARYVATNHAETDKHNHSSTKLVPDHGDAVAWAKFEEAASMELAAFDPAANPLVFEEYFKPRMFGKEPDTNLTQWLRTRLDRTLDNLDTILASQPYTAGQTLSLVDLFYLPYMYHLVEHVWPSCMDQRLNLTSWWGRMKKLECFSAVLVKSQDTFDELQKHGQSYREK